MKKIMQFALPVFMLLAIAQNTATAQRSDTDRYFDESQGFTHRLWYGGGIILGFFGANGESTFSLGATPLIGYKITDNFSIGPRFSLIYTHYRLQTGLDRVTTTNLFDYGIGAFSRYKVFRSFFIHLEYGADNEEFVTAYDSFNDEIISARSVRSNAYVGAGYNDGNGIWGYDIYLLYNTLAPENSLGPPIEFRFGLTYNF
ncbi:hypothetical protein [Phaeodactylibacter sp.]|jgi:hypothetical protein|uniref:hypothetical protein n=1 Tax=Phaeodactylibacter sp. TaxID=1940289 RepID=UPI0025E8F56D|nr:hypothetical protein [Phaeodactylibacter sp.]MCI4647218.1 hypothetical protein [Phaeodactylibacter sp.]MCI5093943.1 hypothetical protein [Phaeodactylibacter sp.]